MNDPKPTNSELIAQFLEHLIGRGTSTHTRTKYEQCLKRLVDFLAAKDSDLVHASPQLLEEFCGIHLHKAGVKPRSRRIYVACVRSFYRWFSERIPGSKNPAERLVYPGSSFNLPRHLAVSDIEKLIGACDLNTFVGTRDAAALMLLYGCGLRVSELCWLNEGDLLFEQTEDQEEVLTLYVRGKGDRERYVPAPRECWIATRSYLGALIDFPYDRNLPNGDKVLFVSTVNSKCAPEHFYGENLRLSRRSFWWTLRRLAEKAGVPLERVKPHALRHSHAVQLLEGGGDLLAVQANLGHARLSTTQIYLSVSMRRRREEIEKADLFGRVQTPFGDLARRLSKPRNKTQPARRPTNY